MLLKETKILKRINNAGGFVFPRELLIFLGFKLGDDIELEFYMVGEYAAFKKKTEKAIFAKKASKVGRVIIPKFIRQMNGLKPNDEIEFFINEDEKSVIIIGYKKKEAIKHFLEEKSDLSKKENDLIESTNLKELINQKLITKNKKIIKVKHKRSTKLNPQPVIFDNRCSSSINFSRIIECFKPM